MPHNNNPKPRWGGRMAKTARDLLTPTVNAGHATCYRCGQPLHPDDPDVEAQEGGAA